jgi:hypothetical protein
MLLRAEQDAGATFIFESTNLSGRTIPCSNNDGCRYVLPPGETVLKHICWLFHFDFMKYRPCQFIECLPNLPTPFLLYIFLCLFLRFNLFSPLFISKRLDGYKREEKRHLKSIRGIVSEWQVKCFFFFLMQDMIRCIFQVSYRSKLLKKFCSVIYFFFPERYIQSLR